MSPRRRHHENRRLHLPLAVRQPDVIEKILTHCGLPDDPPRAPPQGTPGATRELQYVSHLEFVYDPGPQGHAWSAKYDLTWR